MNKRLFTIALAVLPFMTFSQKAGLGVTLGWNQASVLAKNSLTISPVPIGNPYGGLTFQYSVLPHWSMKTALLYREQGYAQQFAYVLTPDETFHIFLNLDYISLPLTFNFQTTGKKFTAFAGGGGYTSLLLSATTEEPYNTITYIPEEGEYQNIYHAKLTKEIQGFRRFDFGAVVNAGVAVRVARDLNVGIEIRAAHSLRPITEPEFFADVKEYNQSLMAGLVLGYTFLNEKADKRMVD